MKRQPACEPPVDPRWLEWLGEGVDDVQIERGRFVDLYLEQRLELRAVLRGGEPQVEVCRTEGAAARWRSPGRITLTARTGLSARNLAEVFDHQISLPSERPLPVSVMDPPRGWIDWAREVGARLAPASGVLRYIARRAAVVRPGRWHLVASPALIRVERDGQHANALLAVWGHPRLGEWLGELVRPAPDKVWSPEPGEVLPVVLTDGTAGVLLHELLGHMTESDLVLDGETPLAPMMGASIADSALNITDDPTRFDLAGGFDCDDEGVPAAPIPLVRDGRLEHFLCDRAGAARIGSEPGRGRRANWNTPPVVRMSNLVMAPGETEPGDLEASVDRGLVVTRLAGAAVDPVSNRTILRVERGWEVRNGKRRRALRALELTGGIMDLLAAIDPRLGNDPQPDWRLGWCIKDGMSIPTGSEAPTVLIAGLEVL
jgi:hypothetical protein